MRTRTLVIAIFMALTVGLVAGPAAQAAPAPVPLKKTVAMTGKTPSGKKFKGTLTIDRFVRSKYTHRLIALGTVKGKVGKKSVTKRNVRVPVKMAQQNGASAARICQVLNLTLGPLHLNLLGLHVDTNTIVVNITADSNGGLLGSLLCSISNLLGPNLTVTQLSQLLNSILGGLTSPVG
jgi:hypothetical protein